MKNSKPFSKHFLISSESPTTDLGLMAHKAEREAKIQSDLAAFLSAGGVIQKLGVKIGPQVPTKYMATL